LHFKKNYPLPFIVIASLVILIVQIVYLILLLMAFLEKKKPTSISLQPVSVIVCAHDEEQNLRELLPRLLAQNHPDFEVIVVEDRSNDGTYDFLREAAQRDSRLKMVRVVNKPEHINGKKFALTLGIKAARHAWVLFTDADCRPACTQWLSTMMGISNERQSIIIGFSPYQKERGLLNAFIRFEALLTGIQYIGFALLGKPYMGVGRNLAYQKALFLNNKGFNNYLGVTGGDDDLFVNQHATRANTQVCIGANAITVSAPKNSWKDFLNQKLRHLSVGRRYKFSDRLMLGVFLLTWMLVWLYVVPFGWTLEMEWMGWTGGLFLLRWALLIGLFHVAAHRLGTAFEAWKVPFLDFIFAFYYLVTGLRALVVKRIRWKN
jgi:glycosyltransferase involved in cell wall biosynthesis